MIKCLIKREDTVLDVGFWGQGVSVNNKNWVHKILKNQAKEVYGLDLDFDESLLADTALYKKASAENFDFNNKFDIIFAGDLIEHLSNPGLFLESSSRNLKEGGRLILTTPNCFNLFNITEKITKYEPTVNIDHTCYFNTKTLKRLLEKNGWWVMEISYLYKLETLHTESVKKKFLNIIYKILSRFTTKYLETLVVMAVRS